MELINAQVNDLNTKLQNAKKYKQIIIENAHNCSEKKSIEVADSWKEQWVVAVYCFAWTSLLNKIVDVF